MNRRGAALVLGFVAASFAAAARGSDDFRQAEARAFSSLAARVPTDPAPAGASAAARVEAIMNAAAHALLSRAAVLGVDQPGGSLTALGALAAIPQARSMLRALEAGSDPERRSALEIANAMELIGAGSIRSLPPDADGWTCDAALAEVLQPLRAHLAACQSPCSPWPGDADGTPIATLAAALALGDEPSPGWSLVWGVVSAWQRALAEGRASDVAQRDAQTLLELHAMQGAAGRSTSAVGLALEGIDGFVDGLLAQIADPGTRARSLRTAGEAARALAEAGDALDAADAALALLVPEAFRREAAAADESVKSHASALRTLLREQLRPDAAAPTQSWTALLACSDRTQAACANRRAWNQLEASLGFIAGVNRPLATKLRARLAEAPAEQRALLVSCTPFPGEATGTAAPGEEAFWQAAGAARAAWLTAMAIRSKDAGELAGAVETFHTVAQWRIMTSHDRPALLAALPRWGGWAPEPFGSMGDLARFRGAVAVATEDLGAGRLPRAREAMDAAIDSLPDASLASVLAPALERHESALPPSSCDAIARALVPPGTAATLANERTLLESIARARLAGHHARATGDADGIAAALARLTELLEALERSLAR